MTFLSILDSNLLNSNNCSNYCYRKYVLIIENFSVVLNSFTRNIQQNLPCVLMISCSLFPRILQQQPMIWNGECTVFSGRSLLLHSCLTSSHLRLTRFQRYDKNRVTSDKSAVNTCNIQVIYTVTLRFVYAYSRIMDKLVCTGL